MKLRPAPGKCRWYDPAMRALPEIRSLIAGVALCCAVHPAHSGEVDDLLKHGAALSEQADYAAAIPLLRRAVALAPQNSSANFLLGVALLESGHPADAAVALKTAAATDPENEVAEGYLGDAQTEQGEFALAAETFQAALTRSPNSQQALSWWADYCLERFRVLAYALRSGREGNAAALLLTAEQPEMAWAEREATLQRAATADPELPDIWGKLGRAQAGLGLHIEAEASLATARRLQPDASSTLELAALVAADRGQWMEAESDLQTLRDRSRAGFQKVVDEWPAELSPGKDAKAPVWSCLRREAAGCSSEAASPAPKRQLEEEDLFREERWEQLSALAPPSPDQSLSWFRRGIAFVQLGDCPQAIPALELGLKAGAEVANSQLSRCYEIEAARTADRLSAEGKQGAVHRIRGDILLTIRRNPSEAAMEYTQALNFEPNNPELMEKLAEADFSLGNMDGARKSAQNALLQNPHREVALGLLARVAMSERDYPTALALLTQLAKMEPEDPWTKAQEGTAYAQTGHPAEAVEQLKPLLDAGYPDEKGALHGLLAAQLTKLGRPQEAKVASDEAIRLADTWQQHSDGK